MAVSDLIQAITGLTATISLIATAVFALSWSIASLIRGSPIPFKELKEFGTSLQMDVVRAAFEISIWSAVSALIGYVTYLISLAM